MLITENLCSKLFAIEKFKGYSYYMKIYDVSQLLGNDTPIYPGNPEFNTFFKSTLTTGTSNVSEITMGSHFGTHIDAPLHMVDKGLSISDIPLDTFIGKCTVLDLTHVELSITEDDIKSANSENTGLNKILVLKTKNSIRGFDEFHPDFIYLEPSAAEYIAGQKIRLLATDGPSVKKFHSEDLIHKFLFDHDVIIAEGLVLQNVEAGEYTFVGAPLKFKGLDASPCRIFLIKEGTNEF